MASTPSNGKVKHHEENNNGRKNGRAKKNKPSPTREATQSTLLAADPSQRQKLLQDFLQGQVARVLGMDASRLSLTQPLDAMDSFPHGDGTQELDGIQVGDQSVSSEFFARTDHLEVGGRTLGNLDQLKLREMSVTSQSDLNESPLSYGQQALWFLHQLPPEEISFNVAGAIRILSDLDIPALEHAFEQLVERHGSLRSTFHAVNGEPVQRVHETMDDFFHGEEAPIGATKN